jgi:hypothetical protein
MKMSDKSFFFELHNVFLVNVITISLSASKVEMNFSLNIIWIGFLKLLHVLKEGNEWNNSSTRSNHNNLRIRKFTYRGIWVGW